MNIGLFKSLVFFVIICFQFFSESEKILKINYFETSFDIYKKEILSQVFNYHMKDKNATHIFYRLVFYKTMKFYPEKYTPYLTFGVTNDDKDYALEEYQIKEYSNYFKIKIKLHQLDYPKYFSWKFLSEKIFNYIHKSFYIFILIFMISKLVLNIKKQYELKNVSYLTIYSQVLMYDFIMLFSIVTKIHQLHYYYDNKKYDLNNWSYKLILSFFAFFKKMNQYVLSSFIVALTYNGENIEFTLDFIFTLFYKVSGNFDPGVKEIFLDEPILVYSVFFILFIGFPIVSFSILRKLYKLRNKFQKNILNDQKLYSEIIKTISIKYFKILSLTITYMILILFIGLLYTIKNKINKEVYDIFYFIIIILFSCSIGYIYYPIILPISYDTPLDVLDKLEIKRHIVYKVNINKFDYKKEDVQKLIKSYDDEFKEFEKNSSINNNEEKKEEKTKYIPFLIINPYTKTENGKYTLKNIDGMFFGEKHL